METVPSAEIFLIVFTSCAIEGAVAKKTRKANKNFHIYSGLMMKSMTKKEIGFYLIMHVNSFHKPPAQAYREGSLKIRESNL